MISNVWILFFFSSSCLLYLGSAIADTCPDPSCQAGEPGVRFPFRLKQLQPNEHCVYPGFDLLRNGLGQMIINLPPLGEFIVDSILYIEPLTFLRDLDDCLPRRFRSFSLLGPGWMVQSYKSFTFINCSRDLSTFPEFTLVPCPSDRNYTVVAVPTEDFERMKGLAMFECVHNWTVLVPTTASEFKWDHRLTDTIGLTWSEPTCGKGNVHDAVCGFLGDKGLETMRTNWQPEEDCPKSGAARLEALVGIGLPWLMIISCVFCCISLKIRLLGRAQHDQTDPASSTGQVEAVLVMTGMDTPMIESYPKTQMGDGGLPLPGDGTCSICLSEYRPEETVQMIPDCNHYFHAHCIYPWLKRNASCPLCRNHQGSTNSTVSS